MDDHQGDRLISAIRGGDRGTVKSLLVVYGMPRMKSGSQHYRFLRESLLNEKEDIARLLVQHGAEVNESENGLATPLHLAAKKGYTEVVSMLLKKAALVNAKDHRNETPLHRAVAGGNLKTIELLLNKMADIEAKSSDGLTPLHRAVKKGNLEVIELLLNKMANIDAKSQDGLTPLHCAVERGNLELIEFLLNKMADIEAKTNNGLTTLHLAIKLLGRGQTSEDNLDHTVVSQGKLSIPNLKVTTDTTDATKTDTNREDIAKLLLDRGANFDARNHDGKTVLQVAVEQCNFRIIEHILLFRPVADGSVYDCLGIAVNSAGVKDIGVVELLVGYCYSTLKDAKYSGLLHNAVRNGYTEIVEDLLTLGADVEAKHKIANGGTLLHSAVASGQIKIAAALLVEGGADVNAKDDMGKTPILYAVENADPDMTKLLLSNGAVDGDVPGLLHRAAERGWSHIIEMILDKIPSIDINAIDSVASTSLPFVEIDHRPIPTKRKLRKNKLQTFRERTKYKLTALHVAAARGFARGVELLLEHNANVDFVAEKVGTPLHCAVLQSDEAIVEMLLLKGADVDARREDGTTALHLALREGNAKAFKLLIKHGANVNAKDDMGKTPILYTVENADSNKTKLLLSNGAVDGVVPSLLHRAAERGWSCIIEMILDTIPNIDINAIDSVASMGFRFVEIDQGSISTKRKLRKNKLQTLHERTNYRVTALHIAAVRGFARGVKLLLEHNANVDFLAEKVGTPLHCAVLQDNVAIVEMLLLKGADVDATREDGTTALHLALRDGNAKAFKCLIKHGADVNAKDYMGKTPILYGNLDMTKLLLSNGAVDGDVPGLLQRAAERGWNHIIEVILNSLDDSGARDINGMTALHTAVDANNFEGIRLLLFHGCDVNIMNDLGRTPLEIASPLVLNCDNFCDRFSRQMIIAKDTGKTQSAAMIEERIVKMMVLGLYVNSNNRRLIDLSSVHKDIYDRCKKEIESMKRTKIGKSKVSFYEFLTTCNRQVVIYSKYQSIAGVLEKSYHKDRFKLYGDMIEWRFRKSKIINDLMDSSARSLNTLSGYCLEDYNYTEIFGYLDVRDLKNVIKAGVSNENSKNRRDL